MSTTRPTIIMKESALAVLAVEVARRHRPVVRGETVTCRACETAWMCPAHTNAEDTIRAAGLSLRDHDGCDDTVESGLEAVPLGSDQTQRITPRKPQQPVILEAVPLDSEQTQRITPPEPQQPAAAASDTEAAPVADDATDTPAAESPEPTVPGKAVAIRAPAVIKSPETPIATDAVAA